MLLDVPSDRLRDLRPTPYIIRVRMRLFPETVANQAPPLSNAFAMNALPLAIAIETGIDAGTIASRALHLEPSGAPTSELMFRSRRVKIDDNRK
jgi:hypothetical protein